MTPSKARYELLIGLAWGLRAVPVSSWLVVPSHAEPVLYVPRRDGRKEAVLATRRAEDWLLLWRGSELDGAQLGAAARLIAMGVAA